MSFSLLCLFSYGFTKTALYDYKTFANGNSLDKLQVATNVCAIAELVTSIGSTAVCINVALIAIDR
jgi:hypothetical protein